MRKETSGRGKEMAPKVAKPAVLSAEAAAMEQKLAELRKAMEKERAKREALMANAGGGSIWRNGSASGGLRANVKGKGPGEGSGPSGSGASSSQRPGSVEAPARQVAAAAPRASSARAAGTGVDGDIPPISGSRLTSSRTAANAGPSEAKGGAVGASRSAAGRSSGGGGAAVGGMSCGTDEGPALGDGAFNEADSHRSFLDALNEWRRANRGDTPADGESESTAAAAFATSSASGTGSGGSLRPRNSAPPQSASLEVQTEARPASRPSSAKPLSYFDKLVINASSRVAGHLAAGGPPESLPLRGSLSGQATGLPRPPSVEVRPSSAGLRPHSAGPSATPKAALAAEASAVRSSSTNAPAAPAGASSALGADVGSGSDGKGDPTDPLSILDRLEALESERQAASHHEDEDEEAEVAAAIRVTTATGMVLTKGTRLPDEVLMPPTEGR